jgi:hypothetical protein
MGDYYVLAQRRIQKQNFWRNVARDKRPDPMWLVVDESHPVRLRKWANNTCPNCAPAPVQYLEIRVEL